MGIISWWFVPEEVWLSKRALGRVLAVTEGKDLEESVPSSVILEKAE